MTFERWNQRPRGKAHQTPMVTLSEDGSLYACKKLTDNGQWPAAAKWAVLFWDAERRLLAIEPLTADEDAGVKIFWDRHHATLRTRCVSALKAWGLYDGRKHWWPAQWVDGRIVCDVDAESKPQMNADQRRSSDESRATDREPRVTGHGRRATDRDLTPDEAKTFLAIKRTCEQCAHWTSGICTADDSPRSYMQVGAATPACPTFESILGLADKRRAPGPGPRATDPPSPPSVARRPQARRRPRCRCRVCGTEHSMTPKGRPWAHDADGVDYRAGRGDRDRRCPGSDQKGTSL